MNKIVKIINDKLPVLGILFLLAVEVIQTERGYASPITPYIIGFMSALLFVIIMTEIKKRSN